MVDTPSWNEQPTRETPDTASHRGPVAALRAYVTLRGSVRRSIRLAGSVALAGTALVAAHAHRSIPAPAAVTHQPPHTVRRAPTPPPRAEAARVVANHDAERESAQREIAVLAETLQRLRVRNPELLASAVHAAVSGTPDAELLPFLLAIARTETDGRILAVSSAWAVGLAQATPIAAIAEGVTDPLYVTQDYIDGAFAYTMKKPLDDVGRIADTAQHGGDRAEAIALLDRACALRRTGIDELLLLEPYEAHREGVPSLAERIEEQDRRNIAWIDALRTLIVSGAPDADLASFSARVTAEYRTLRAAQRTHWKQYEADLTRRRDAALRTTYHDRPLRQTLDAHAYEAGTYLGSTLDARFDPDRMATFLRAHVQRIREQLVALEIAGIRPEPEQTAMLYNAGRLNVLRADAGLATLPRETQQYVVRVTRTQGQLEAALEQERGRSAGNPQ